MRGGPSQQGAPDRASAASVHIDGRRATRRAVQAIVTEPPNYATVAILSRARLRQIRLVIRSGL